MGTDTNFISRAGFKTPPEIRDRVKILLKEGRTQRSIAKELGLASSTIWYIKKNTTRKNYPRSKGEKRSIILPSSYNTDIKIELIGNKKIGGLLAIYDPDDNKNYAFIVKPKEFIILHLIASANLNGTKWLHPNQIYNKILIHNGLKESVISNKRNKLYKLAYLQIIYVRKAINKVIGRNMGYQLIQCVKHVGYRISTDPRNITILERG